VHGLRSFQPKYDNMVNFDFKSNDLSWKTNFNGAKVLSWTGPTEYRGPVSIFIIGQLATDRTKLETGHLC
jgi:hypothetical protein